MTDTRKTAQVAASILIVVALLVILPGIIKLLRGVSSIGGIAGSILSSPGKIIDELNRQFDQSVVKEIERECYLLSVSTQYNSNNPDHKGLMIVLQSGEIPNAKSIIETWKKPMFQKIGAYAGLSGSVEAVKQKLLKLF